MAGWAKGGEIGRLVRDVETLRRPVPVRARGGQWRRDPAPEWDWFYLLPPDMRQWMIRHVMAPADGSGQAPDQLAALAHFDYVEDWAAALVQACQCERDRTVRDPLADDWTDYAAETAQDDLVGPDEVSALLEVERNTLAQWRHRGHLPRPDLVVSGMPIWHERTIVQWARRTGREIVE